MNDIELFILIIMILVLCSCYSLLINYISKVLFPEYLVLDPKNTNAEVMKPALNNSLITHMHNKYHNNWFNFSNFSDNKAIMKTDIMSQLYDKLIVMSSSYRVTIIIDKNVILDENKDKIYFVILSLIDGKFFVKQSQSFDINCCREEIIKMINFIKTIKDTDIVIIASKGKTFNSFSNTDDISKKGILALHTLGAKTNVFRKWDNYLFVRSSEMYELSSPETIYFPTVDITFEDCRLNPNNILYPKNYVLFSDKTYGKDKLTKCAMETIIRQHNKFGIMDNYCIPMSDNDYLKYKQMAKSDKCVFGEGKNSADIVSGYVIGRPTGMEQTGVSFYEKPNLQGRSFTLNIGEYNVLEFNKQDINSINIPDNYFLFMIKESKITPFYGPLKTDLTIIHKQFFDDFDSIVIQKHFKGNSIICGEYDKQQICMTFSKGTHVFPQKLFIRILYVMLGDATRLTLFDDINWQNLIGDYYSKVLIKVKYPRITRSVVIS